MIIWQDSGLIIRSQILQEKKIQLHVFTRQHGLCSGLCFGKKALSMFQPGLPVTGQWKARLPEHMGVWSLDITSYMPWVILIQNAPCVRALNAACALYYKYLPERHEYNDLFDVLQNFLDYAAEKKSKLRPGYLALQICMLQALGYHQSLNIPFFKTWLAAYNYVITQCADHTTLQNHFNHFWQILSSSA